jgi:hypothetical protein
MPSVEMPMLEMSVPEYFVTHITKVAPAGGDCIRMFACVQRGNVLEPVYSCVIPMARWEEMIAKSARVVSAKEESAEYAVDMRPRH